MCPRTPKPVSGQKNRSDIGLDHFDFVDSFYCCDTNLKKNKMKSKLNDTILTTYKMELETNKFPCFGRISVKTLNRVIPGITDFIHLPTFKYTGVLRLNKKGKLKAKKLLTT
jgi:hypothetical protein